MIYSTLIITLENLHFVQVYPLYLACVLPRLTAADTCTRL